MIRVETLRYIRALLLARSSDEPMSIMGRKRPEPLAQEDATSIPPHPSKAP